MSKKRRIAYEIEWMIGDPPYDAESESCDYDRVEYQAEHHEDQSKAASRAREVIASGVAGFNLVRIRKVEVKGKTFEPIDDWEEIN